MDLPMPGSPPTSTTLPGTRPPPSTRSSSAMPVAARGAASADTSRERERAPVAGARAGASSRSADRSRRRAAARLLDERLPGAAARAAPEPARLLRAALGADVDRSRPRQLVPSLAPLAARRRRSAGLLTGPETELAVAPRWARVYDFYEQPRLPARARLHDARARASCARRRWPARTARCSRSASAPG